MRTFLFSNIFLSIIWEFHMFYPSGTYFPVLPCDPPPQKRRKKRQEGRKEGKIKEIYTKSNCPYTHWSMIKRPVSSPLKKTESLPTPTPSRSHQLKSYTSTSLSEYLEVLFNGFLSRQFLLGHRGVCL